MTAELIAPRRTIGARDFDFARRAAVMAIVNRTPDSFFDRGATFALDAAVTAALDAVAAGADWVDVGGVPFSPDTPEVSVAEEIDRVVPIVEAVAARSDVVISIDTARAEVAAAGLAAGASVVNDTNGVRDPAMLELLAGSDASVIVTHSLAAPHVHHPRPRYDDVVTEVVTFLRDRVAALVDGGIEPQRLFIDPGPDLNKNTRHTLALLRRFGEITAIGLPTLVAVSNKDFVGESLDRERDERLAGSLAATTLAVAAGARVVRTHHVPQTVDAVRMTEVVLGLREPAYLRHNT
ncbi:dihydropteroate synthase [Georgenia sp. MJ170]|uniref:dihydropteroate synthase n=1 Tax=Georgenia sunbinii TaxID=3117728 RepID=UPI002F26BDD0